MLRGGPAHATADQLKAALQKGLGVLVDTKLDRGRQPAFTRRKANGIRDCMRRSGQ